MPVLSFKKPESEFLKTVESSRKRKDDARLRLDLLYDRHAADLLATIAQRWRDPDTVATFAPVFVNLIKKIITKSASVYHREPRRTFENWDQQAGEALYESLKANTCLKQANRLTRLLKTTAIQVVWDSYKPRLCLVTPNILDAEYNYPDSPSRLIVTHLADRPDHVTYSDWSPFAYNRRDSRGNLTSTEPNPYGRLPFVSLFDRYPDSDYFLPGGEDLVAAQRALNVALSNIWRATETQAHGVPVITGLQNADALKHSQGRGIGSGADVVISLPQSADLKFVSPDAPILDMLKACEFLIRQTAAANDLSPDLFDLSKTSGAQSGSAKAQESVDLTEARRDQQELYRQYEADLFDTVKTVVNTHSPGSIPDDARITVDFVDPDRHTSEADRLAGYRERIELGLWSPVDALLTDNPDIRDRETALKLLSERRNESAALGQAFTIPSFESTA